MPVTHTVQRERYSAYWQPNYWPTWLLFAIAFSVTRLPFRAQLAFGSLLGIAGYHLARSRRHITEVNVGLCFPDLPLDKQSDLVRRIFRSTGMGLVETANAWFRDARALRARVTVEGLEHLEQAAADGRGVILAGMHFATLDLCGALLSTYIQYDVMYRRNRNPLLNLIMERSRARNFPISIDRKDIRGIVASLRAGHIVWYGPDQDYGRRHSVFAPFFGVPAASITATARLARMTGAPIIFFSHYREEGGTYRIVLSEPLAGFPTGDDVADATTINRHVESAVQQSPEQYWWVHRRFKTRPEGEERPY